MRKVVSKEGEKGSGRLVSWEGGKCGRVVCWKGGKGGSIVRWQGWGGWKAVMGKVGKGGEGGGEVVRRWQGRKGARVLGWQVLDFIFLFLMLISNGTKEQDKLKIIWLSQRNGRTRLRSSTSY